MSHESVSMRAGGTIRPLRFVSQSTSADNTALEANEDDLAIGVTNGSSSEFDTANHAVAGEAVRMQRGRFVSVTAGAAITAGARLQIDNDGRAVTYAASDTSVGTAIEGASAAGDVIEIFFIPQNAT